MKAKIICIVLIICLVISCTGLYQVIAATQSELESQQSEINSQISDKEEAASEVTAQLSGALKEVQELNSQISDYENSITELNNQISEKETEISNKEQEIVDTQNDIDEKQSLLDQRLVSLYMSGQTSYIDLLLSSADLTDFISKYYLISELATYDTDLIQSIKDSKTALETAKTELETAKTELESNRTELENAQSILENTKSEKETKVASLTAEEKEIEEELALLEREKKELQNELAAIAKEESEKGGSVTYVSSPSAAGYIFPVQGLSKANIKNKTYPSYSGHTGVDVNINVVGKNVVAVKDGTVVKSEARIENGIYYSYGEYIVINHHDGTMTLYAHMQAGSRTVSVGDTVSQGQVIGKVGSTGNSTGPHLHFEVRINGRPDNPLPYLP